MKLQDNGGDSITVQNFGPFTFPTALKAGSTYDVTILTQPANGQTCAVQNGSGTVTGTINSVLVNCYQPITVGGSVFGLLGSGLALQNNGGDTLQVDSNGTFQFSSTIAYGQNYSVTVAAQPVNPAQICRVTNGTSATLPQSNVTNVLVSCGSAAAQWTWMSGSNVAGSLGNFGAMGVPDAANVPSARSEALTWVDKAGNLWLFGGGGYDASGNDGALNDLWRYSGGVWTYMSGSELARQLSYYGPLGMQSSESLPGGCSGTMRWTDESGRLWAYCFNDNSQAGSITSANDLWVYQP